MVSNPISLMPIFFNWVVLLGGKGKMYHAQNWNVINIKKKKSNLSKTHLKTDANLKGKIVILQSLPTLWNDYNSDNLKGPFLYVISCNHLSWMTINAYL